MKLQKGKKYHIIVENQLCGGRFVRETNTLFNKRYLFAVDVTERDEEGNLIRTVHNVIYKVKREDIFK